MTNSRNPNPDGTGMRPRVNSDEYNLPREVEAGDRPVTADGDGYVPGTTSHTHAVNPVAHDNLAAAPHSEDPVVTEPTEVSYQDGYVHGQVAERHLYEDEDESRSRSNVARGVLLGIALVSLIGLAVGTIFAFRQPEEEPIGPTVAPGAPPADVLPSPTEPTDETTIIERQNETTTDIVPVPAISPTTPTTQPDVNIIVPPTTSQPQAPAAPAQPAAPRPVPQNQAPVAPAQPAAPRSAPQNPAPVAPAQPTTPRSAPQNPAPGTNQTQTQQQPADSLAVPPNDGQLTDPAQQNPSSLTVPNATQQDGTNQTTEPGAATGNQAQ
ncbi:MAG: hypothetical protein KME06_06955 [Kastovskya adunca ATA6-11-RM4]|nr:hypothetical protein [Kastovskya adunca ATA6-11-RM4]